MHGGGDGLVGIGKLIGVEYSRTTVNEAASSCTTPVINLGQGFFGYNPPEYVLNAAKDALNRVDCNQYSPTKVAQIFP